MAIPTVISKNSLNELYEATVHEVLEKGKEVNVRGTKSLELHPCILHLTNPMNRTLVFPRRGNNPFATLFETLWVLSGTNSIEHLKFFLPRAADFSDNGTEWRAGYGFRIFNWSKTGEDINTGNGIDQFYQVFMRLAVFDEYSRQAIITLWDPAHDYQENLRDYPCSNHLAFLRRGNKLDLTVTIRSNDALWGMSSINVYEFTVMQEIMAKMLGIEVGEYYHIANSMHLYTHGYNADKNLPNVKKSIYLMDRSGEVKRGFFGFPILLEIGKEVMEYMHVQGVKPFEFKTIQNNPGACFLKDDNNYTATMEDYRKVYKITCDMIDAPTLADMENIFNSHIREVANSYLLNYMFLYIIYTKYGDTPAFRREWEYISKQMPLTDLQVSAEYWLMKKTKEIEPHDYRAAVDKCTTRKGV